MGSHTTSRRLAAATSLAALVGAAAVATAPASSASEDVLEPGQHRLAASAQALEVNLFGQGLTIGLAEVDAISVPRAAAHAIGAAVPGLGIFGEERAAVSGADQSDGDDQPTCSPIVLPPEVPVVDLAVACGTAAASSAAADPLTTTSAGVAHLAVSATELLNDTPLAQLPVQETVDQILGGLAPVFEVVEQLGLDAQSLVSELLSGITQGGEVLAVDLGPGTAGTTSTDSRGTATANAQGAVVTVIDRALLGLPPVLTIEVSAAAAEAVSDATTGAAEGTVTPALVKVTVAQDVATLLGLPTNVIEVAPGQSQCIPLPAPLESCITVAGGRVVDTADGGKRAETQGVGLQLLTGLPDGGIVLNLAATSAEAAALAPELARQDGPAPQQPALARTGFDSSLPLALGLGAAGAAGLALVATTRRRPL